MLYLLGNKIDLVFKEEKEREISKEEAIKFANEHNLRYFEISSKDNIGIKEFNIDLVNELIKTSK